MKTSSATWRWARRPSTQRKKAAKKSRWPCSPPPSPPPSSSSPLPSFSGVSKYIFTPLALGVVLSIFASYFFAMTVVPLFCAKFIRIDPHGMEVEDNPDAVLGMKPDLFAPLRSLRFNEEFQRYAGLVRAPGPPCHCSGPASPPPSSSALSPCSLSSLVPFLGRAYFPRTDPGQFIINVRMPSGTRLRSQQRLHRQGREHHPQRGQAQRPRHDRLQHRRLSRSLRHLHHQRLHGHGLRADQPEAGSQRRQLRVHAPRAGQARARDARALHLLPGRRSDRRRHQPGPARAHRHSDQIAAT